MKFEMATDSCVELIESEFHRIDLENEEDFSMISPYIVRFLDVYPHKLSIDASARLLSSHQEHNLKYEDRFIKTINALFEKNRYEVVVCISNINEGVDLSEIRKLKCTDLIQLEHKIIRIKCVDDLEKITKLSTRE